MNTHLKLKPVPPFRLDLTVWTLRRRPDNQIDRWDGETYRRIIVGADGKPFDLAVRQTGSPTSPLLHISASGRKFNDATKRQIVSSVERLLGIHLVLDDFYAMAKRDKKLKPLAERFRGFKPPKLLSPFEALINAFACQQLTLTVGIRLLNGLAGVYGQALETEAGTFRAFPRPEDLAGADHNKLRELKFSYQKARYMTGLSHLLINKAFDLDGLGSLDDRAALERLCDLKGVGRWTSEYCLLRGFGRTHIFPADDVGARNNLERWLELPGKLNYETVHQRLGLWDRFGGLIYFHLLLNSLVEKSAFVP